MPFYRVGGLMCHIKLTGKAKKNAPAPCAASIPRPGNIIEGGKSPLVRCMAMSGYLCDWPVGESTCDAPLCVDHAVTIGRNRHLCPKHFLEHAAAERRGQLELGL